MYVEPHSGRTIALFACLALLLVAAAPAGAAERRVPQGWLGVTADGPMHAGAGGEWDAMAAAGVESVRTAVRWYALQPYGSAAEVPPSDAPRFRDAGGIPTDFSGFDAVVASAAARGLSVLPVVESTPAWAARVPGDIASPPVDAAAFGRFVAALAGRYGPQGTFWAERPDLPRMPVRAWQIWNEPNLTVFWSVQPFAPSYVQLLQAAHRALATADPGATVVLAGLTNESWTALRAVYAAGGRGAFDAVALHPYTRRPQDVLRILRRGRRIMRAAGDRALPLWITEVSWPAAQGRVAPRDVLGIETTERGQAARLARVLRLLAPKRRALRIERFIWYTWLSAEAGPTPFDWSGLRRLRSRGPISTPALAVFREAARRLEGCRKGTDARRCAR